MKNLSTLLLGLAFAATATAQSGFRVKTFPSVMQRAEVKAPSQAQKAPLNEDKQLGKLAYASTQDDYFSEPGIIKFYTGNTYESEKISIIYEGNDDLIRSRVTLLGAAWYENEEGEGAYYGYSVINYDMGFTYPQHFMKIDLETGEKTNIADLTDVKGGWQIVDDMKQNPVDHKLYAVRQAADGFYSEFGTVDPANGDFTILAQMDNWYPSIAYDADGVLYAVRPTMKSLGKDEEGYETYEVVGSMLVTLEYKDGRIDEVDKLRLTQNDQAYKMYYTNTIAFDQETGELYAALMDVNSWNQTFYTINRQTGELNSKGSCYGSMRGLYLPNYKTKSREVAAKVSNVSSTFGDKGQSITLKWTNPTKQLNGNDLTELAEVRIFLSSPDALPYAVIPAEGKMGEEMTWTDEDPGEGVRTYFIVPCRKEGEKGYPESWKAWAGADVPAAPQNVTATSKGTSILLEWTAPTTGSHEGWLNAEDITYKVLRYPDEKLVASGLKVCQYEDTELPSISNYYYKVTACTSVGEGDSSQSWAVTAGPALDLPYAVSIDSYEKAGAWSVIDNNGDGTYFSFSDYEPKGLRFYTNSPGESDDYAVSPAVKLEKGKKYRVDMTININYPYDEEDRPDHLHDFDFVAGMGNTAEALTHVFFSERAFKNLYYGNIASNNFVSYFTATETGEWNVALHWLTKNVFDWITLEKFAISEVFDNDLAITKYEVPAFATQGTPGDFYVEVTNVGSKRSGAYTVQVFREDGEEAVLMGEANVADEMNFGTTHRIYVPAVSTVTGVVNTFARLVYDADQNLRNNESETMAVTVDAEGTVPFNGLFHNGMENTIDTRVPISSYDIYSTFQVIYYPTDLNTEVKSNKLTLSRLGLSYDSNEGGTFSDYKVKVYLNSTDKKTYTCTDWDTRTDVSEWVSFGDCYFDGLVSTAEGAGNVLSFDLDKTFEYDMSKNLVVTIVKEEGQSDNQYPVLFNHFFADADGSYGSVVRSLFYGGKSQFNFDTNKVFGKHFLPILSVAAAEFADGINEVSFGSSALNYDAQSGMLRGMGNGSVSIYNVSGQLVSQSRMADGQMPLQLQSGLYIVKFNGANGEASTLKLQVK